MKETYCFKISDHATACKRIRTTTTTPDLPSSPLTPTPSDITSVEQTYSKTVYDDSSSDSESNNTHISYSQPCKMTKSAHVDQPATNKPLKLTPGKLTPEVTCDWDNACVRYFMHKEIEAGDQVKMITFGMQDPHLHMWYLAQ
jgi:hypothetical protein